MIDVYEHIKQSIEDRQKHLVLKEPCVNTTGRGRSGKCKTILAQYLGTNIPSGNTKGRVVMCHACHNCKCENPKHLYWGTDKENCQDSMNNGTFYTGWESRVNLYGYEKACEMNARSSESAAKSGSGNKGKPKSESHKKKVSEGLKRYHAQRRLDKQNRSGGEIGKRI